MKLSEYAVLSTKLSTMSFLPMLLAAAAFWLPAPAQAAHTPDPASVTVAGSLQDELGCPGDWQPDCAATHLGFDAEDDVWQGVFPVPAGSFEYKAALNDSWDENYGVGGEANGPNIPLALADGTNVKFYYSHETHWITDNVNSVIATAAGSFQEELGCSGDWQPWCLRSWLQDPDGDGVFTFRTRALPAGGYEFKVAISEDWAENYGDGGVPGGSNISFTVPADCVEMLFEFDYATKVPTVGVAPPPAQPASVTIPGSFQDELGCPGDWQPDCAVTHLTYDAEDTVWQETFPNVPAGSWEYKAALNDSWDENYGENATRDGSNIALGLSDPTDVKFYYEHGTHWVTSNQNAVIATVPGSFQSALGCSGDWQPWCLRSWLQDPDGDGFHHFSAWLPAGSYEAKVAINESWDENYGDGGVPGGPNIPFTVPASCTEVFFNYDPVSHILTIGAEGGPQGNLSQARAHWVSEDTVAWNAGSAGDTFALHYDADGNLSLDDMGVVGGDSIPLTWDPAGLDAGILAKFPHLAGYAALELDAGDLGLVPVILEGQIAISAAAPAGTPIDATSAQIPGVLDDLYTYDDALGPVFDGGVPTLAVWAPTARSVSLLLFDDSDPASTPAEIPMVEDAATGVWSVTGSPAWDRMFYLYEVEVYAPSTGQVETNRVTDPYSLSLSVDSQLSQIVDLDDWDLKPFFWNWLRKPRLEAPEDIAIYELHVRDFSIADRRVPEWMRGTYVAFALPRARGAQHLRRLARAGLTHVHLLPSFDFTTVPEDRDDQVVVDQDELAMYPPDSDQQQAAIAAVKDQDGFNWGYDPWHYTVPEGSYSAWPDGAYRIRHFRTMVAALNRLGLRVVMDVVYNHTNAAGQNQKAVLDRIVPGYYHRLSLTGDVETSSCCPNTASEHAMMEKLLIDSVLTWATDYKVDGFRFDLMGHHSKANMLALRAALDALTVPEHGVDGSRIYVYGEGWNFGEVANDARFEQATQRNMAGTGIGTFSDRLRDGVRGGNPFSDVREQGFINGLCYDSSGFPQGDECAELLHISDWVRIGLAADIADFTFVDSEGNLVRADEVDYFGQQAGYTADPQENIKYIAAHDNETLFDTTQLKAPQFRSLEERVRIQNLGNSIVALGQGIPFFHAGQEMLRSKSMDRDSFNSGDWFNQLDFTFRSTNWGNGLPTAEKNQSVWPIMQPLLADPALAPDRHDVRDAFNHMRELLRIRKSSKLFRLRTGDEVKERVRFHNTGPSQIPGLIVTSVSNLDGGIDDEYSMAVTLINAGLGEIEISIAETAGLELELHGVFEGSSDPVVRGSSFDEATGTFTVPARTTAVFVAEAEDDDGNSDSDSDSD